MPLKGRNLRQKGDWEGLDKLPRNSSVGKATQQV